MTRSAPHSGFGSRLRAARQAAKLTQVELAKRAGTRQTILSRLERGETLGTPEVLQALGKALKVTVSHLLGEDTADHAVRPTRKAVAADRRMPKGLRELAEDEATMKAMHVTARELRTLASIDLPAAVGKDGYVQLLLSIRAVTGGRP